MSLASSIVGFLAIVPSQNICFVILPSGHTLLFPVFYRQPAHSRASRSVRQRDTLIPPANIRNADAPLPVATSLFDCVVCALQADGMKIALTSAGKSRLPHQETPPGRLP